MSNVECRSLGIRHLAFDIDVTRLSRLDWLLLLMTLIWGTNWPLVKSVFREIDPQAFNALRLVLASCVMAATSRFAGRMARPDPPAGGAGEIAGIFHTPAEVTRRDWVRLAWLGIVGHCLYQYLFRSEEHTSELQSQSNLVC